MKTRQIITLGACLLGFIGAGLASSTFAQQATPMESKGVQAEVIQALDLGEQIPAMEGYQLRMRLITLEPGGVGGVVKGKGHSHSDRPGMVYVLEGTFTDHREGSPVKEHHVGGSWAEGKGTVHWGENRGTTPLLILAVDLVKKK